MFKEFLVYCDVLEFVIVVVCYVKVIYFDGFFFIGFVFGKVKVFLLSGYIILRLELCVVVFVVEVV